MPTSILLFVKAKHVTSLNSAVSSSKSLLCYYKIDLYIFHQLITGSQKCSLCTKGNLYVLLSKDARLHLNLNFNRNQKYFSNMNTSTHTGTSCPFPTSLAVGRAKNFLSVKLYSVAFVHMHESSFNFFFVHSYKSLFSFRE